MSDKIIDTINIASSNDKEAGIILETAALSAKEVINKAASTAKDFILETAALSAKAHEIRAMSEDIIDKKSC